MSLHVIEAENPFDQSHHVDHVLISDSSSLSLPQNMNNLFYYSDDGQQLQKRLFIGDGITTPITPNNLQNFMVGEGSFGRAYKAVLKLNDNGQSTKCVVKFPKDLLDNGYLQIDQNGRIFTNLKDTKTHIGSSQREFYKEIDVLITLKKGKYFVQTGITHPNIRVEARALRDALHNDEKFQHDHPGTEYIHNILEFNEGIMPCLVSEFCHGNLRNINKFLNHHRHTGFSQANYFSQNSGHQYGPNDLTVSEGWKRAVHEIFLGISYMHSLSISHNDIKPDNIFFIATPNGIICKISDFGFCDKNKSIHDVRGTPSYFSPELQQAWRNLQGSFRGLSSSTTNPFSNDVFSLAFMCLEFLFMNIRDAEFDSIHKVRRHINDIYQYYSSHSVLVSHDRPQSLLSIIQKMCICYPEPRLELFQLVCEMLQRQTNNSNWSRRAGSTIIAV